MTDDRQTRRYICYPKLLLLSLMVALAGFAGCGAGTQSQPASTVAPSIVSQPQSVAVMAGQSATFSVTAGGTAPLSYQWQRNGANIAGGTSTVLTMAAVTSADNGTTVQVVVSNAAGSITSAAATLTVNSPPSITTQPANQVVTLGQMATFTVIAAGTSPLTYQWQKNGSNISGATTSNYTTPPTVSTDNGATFDVIVTNAFGSMTSASATLSINAPPSITTQPANSSVTVGQMATFSVVASGSGTLTYQWRKNGSNISGATASSYATPATTASDNGATFQVVVSNSFGSTPSNTVTLTVNSLPAITTQPQSQSVTVGQTATFSVAASGSGTLAYQWKKNSANISGATASSYTTPATTAGDNGATFQVVVSNAFGSTPSNTVTLTVNEPPSITTQPQSETVLAGQTATFSVVASGGGSLTYQWKKNGSNISGATASSFTTAATTSADNNTTFQVVVTNAAGSTPSNTVTLTVNSPPSITTQPANQTVTVGQTAIFSVVATGTGTLSYQWRKSGSDISGATATNYTTPATTNSDNGSTFDVVVTNAFGSKTSATVTLIVNAATTSISVLTHHYDNFRTGQNTSETILTHANVNSTTFGKLFSQPVDGQIYAQPLYMPNLAVAGKGTHNVIFVATENDSVYAFDADNNSAMNASPLWHANLIDAGHGAAAGAVPMPASDIGCGDLSPIVGITATPVIDPVSGTMYVVAKSKENGGYIHRLHAIDITTGNEKASGPVVITATISPSTGDGSSNGQLVFDPLHHNARPGLLLLNGSVFIAFASHCDISPYHGWLFAYDAGSLAQQGVFITTKNGGLGGFWMGGSGIAADASGNIFIASGNGTYDVNAIPARELSDTIMKLSLSNGTINLIDYFTPGNQDALSGSDEDVGSGGVLLLPDQSGAHPHQLVEAGKEGRIYEIDRDMMTLNNQHFCNGCANDSEIIQESSPGFTGGLWSMPAYWNNNVYLAASGSALLSIPITNGLLGFTSVTSASPTFSFPGATPTITSNGTSDGIVWVVAPSSGAAVLHAYDATHVQMELYNSTQAQSPANRDKAGTAVKMTPPVAVNGKVYVSTSVELDVYGLLP